MLKSIRNHNLKNDEYVPGQCNLGNKEIRRRRFQSFAGLIISIVLIFVIEHYHLIDWKLIVIVPIFYTIICFLQARNKFCVVFGINGSYSFSDVRRIVTIEDKEYRLKDRIKALKILFISIFIAISITIIYFYLSV